MRCYCNGIQVNEAVGTWIVYNRGICKAVQRLIHMEVS